LPVAVSPAARPDWSVDVELAEPELAVTPPEVDCAVPVVPFETPVVALVAACDRFETAELSWPASVLMLPTAVSMAALSPLWLAAAMAAPSDWIAEVAELTALVRFWIAPLGLQNAPQQSAVLTHVCCL